MSAVQIHPHEILPPPSTLENVWNGTVEVACAVAEAVKNGAIQLGTWISIGWEHAVVWFKDAGVWLNANVLMPTSRVIADFFGMIWAGLVKVYNVVTPYLVGFVNWSQGKILNGWHSFTQLVKQNPVATIAVISAFVLGALAGALIRGCCATAAPAQDAPPPAAPAAPAPAPAALNAQSAAGTPPVPVGPAAVRSPQLAPAPAPVIPQVPLVPAAVRSPRLAPASVVPPVPPVPVADAPAAPAPAEPAVVNGYTEAIL